MDGWNTFSFPFRMAYFQGLFLLVSGSVVISSPTTITNQTTGEPIWRPRRRRSETITRRVGFSENILHPNHCSHGFSSHGCFVFKIRVHFSEEHRKTVYNMPWFNIAIEYCSFLCILSMNGALLGIIAALQFMRYLWISWILDIYIYNYTVIHILSLSEPENVHEAYQYKKHQALKKREGQLSVSMVSAAVLKFQPFQPSDPSWWK